MKLIKWILFSLCLINLSWGALATKITSDTQLIPGDHALGVVGDYLISNDSVDFIISDIPNSVYPGNTGGLCIDAALNGGMDDFVLMYLYLDKDWPRQGNYNALQIVSAGSPNDSAHIRVRGVDSENAAIAITTDYILYDNTSMLKLVTRFYNQSETTVNSYDMGDAFSWGSDPFVPSGNSSTSWLASKTPNTLYGYMAHENFEAIHGSYWSDATINEVDILAGDSASILRYFTCAEDLQGIYNTYLDMKNLSTGQVSVSVIKEGLPVNNALIYFLREMESGPTLEGHTNDLGFLNSHLETGNWICRVTAAGQNKEKSFSISTDSHQNISFTLGATITPTIGQDTLTIIQSPLINIPSMSLPGDTISVKISLPVSESVLSLSLLFNKNITDLNFTETSESSPFGLRTLEAYLPSSMLYGLYDLKLTCTGIDSLDISEHSLYVIPEYKNNFSFIHVTDTHLPSHYYWGDDGLEEDSTEIEDFRAVIDDINIINPDFVLHTGDFINDGEIEELGVPSISRGKKLLYELDVPLFLVSGNHDLGGWDSTPASDGTARRTWWKYFGWKYLNSTSSTATTTQNYSFNYGNAHFMGLEAYDNYDEWRYDLYGETSFISSQFQWLSEDLAEHSSADLKVLFYHYDFKHELNLSALGVDAAFWGHVHGNNEDAVLPYDISTAATCDGARWYRIVKIVNNEITFNRAIQAGYLGETLIKTVNTDHSLVRITNNSNIDFEDCLVKFHLEDGMKIDSLTNADLFQIDSLSSPRIVYALVDVPAGNTVDASILTDSIETKIATQIPITPFILNIYPNPFNPRLSVNYQLSIVSMIDISIYNIQGKIVDTLFVGEQYPGTYELNWNASNQPSGLYFVKASITNTSGKFQTVEKCLLMK
ncbi:MAG: metallophosphoesterase [Candidatus Marinimicrobia bacterium]|nr:metallophosphoesterase [Candidatus Neomarinimicrobiota bacterium]